MNDKCFVFMETNNCHLFSILYYTFLLHQGNLFAGQIVFPKTDFLGQNNMCITCDI